MVRSCAKRVGERIFLDLHTKDGCFRLLNGTHQTGCTSGHNGNVGVAYYLESEDDWTVVMTGGATAPYMPIINYTDFTASNVRKLVHSGRVSGIVVLNVDLDIGHVSGGFSADSSCPNSRSGYYGNNRKAACKDVTWNPTGDGLLFDDLGIPMFSITLQSDADIILRQCWEPFNKPIAGVARAYPLCAVELVATMAASRDAATCHRQSNLITNLNPVVFCDPLGDKNVLAPLRDKPTGQPRPPNSSVLVATRMDSFGMFYNEYPAADTTVAAIVTLLATAKAVWKMKEVIQQESDTDIIFAFLQGEAFDYIGSSRMLYDMGKGHFLSEPDAGRPGLPSLSLTHIAQLVELSQVGLRLDADRLWLHTDPTFRRRSGQQVDRMLRTMTEFGAGSSPETKFSRPDEGQQLPPSSAQRFMMEAGESPLPLFVITDHQRQFTNKYYNSRLDVAESIRVNYSARLHDDDHHLHRSDNGSMQLTDWISSLATALARYLFWAATDRPPTPEQLEALMANRNDVTEMLHCFLHNARCELFHRVIDPENASKLRSMSGAYPFYVSISGSTNQVTSLVQRVLAYFTGEPVDGATEDSCKRSSLLWMQGTADATSGKRAPVCYNSTVLLTRAESPAFDIEGYDWKSGRYSTWAESRWDDFRVRVFLVPSKAFQTTLLSVGVVLLIVSLLAVYWVKRKAGVLFAPIGPYLQDDFDS